MTGATSAVWPEKTHEMHNHHMDSTVWNDFVFRDGDIVIATYGKSGTTWMQQIVSQLVFDGAEGLSVAEMSPWLDLRVPPKEVKLAAVEAQTHRRFVKTHLPVDALTFSPKAKYIYIGRDGRDTVWSLHNHHATANAMFYGVINDTPGRVGPELGQPLASRTGYFQAWLDGDGYPFWPFWDNVRSWWSIRDLPNVLFVHFADLKRDLDGETRRIADFLDISIAAEQWPIIIEHCSFDYMKRNGDTCVPLGGALWEGGPDAFLHKGVNGRWRDELSAAQSEAYERRAVTELGAECARWLAAGCS